MPARKRPARQHAICDRAECGLRHSVFSACADGFRKRIPFQRASSSVPAAATPPDAPPAPEPAVVAAAEPDLALITDPDELAKYMPPDLARELAERRQNDRIEKDWHDAEAATGIHLVKPERLRKKSPAAAAALLGQLDQVLGDAKSQARNIPTADEVRSVHTTLASIPAKRDAEESAAREAAKPKEHVNGSTDWICVNPACGKRFGAASLEVVRRKAKAEPQWKFVCPHCQSQRVMLYEAA